MTTIITAERRRILADDREEILAMYPHKMDDPMPEALHQEPHLVEILSMLKNYFAARPDVLVSGDTFVYSVEGDPTSVVSPDCYVALGVDDDEVRKDESYIVWRAGKAPDFALEIGSKSTARRDQVGKRELYASMRILEYWRFDPTGTRHYDVPLAGDRLVDDAYQPIEMTVAPDGVTRGYSEVLGLDLCWEEGHLRFYDPVVGEFLRTPSESETQRLAAEQRAATAEADLAAAEAELERLRAKLRPDA